MKPRKLLTPLSAKSKVDGEVLIFVLPENMVVFREQPEAGENVFSDEIKALILLG